MIKKIGILCMTLALLAGCTGGSSEKKEGSKLPQEEFETRESSDDELFLLVGTYTSEEGSKGIYLYRFDTVEGTLDSISMVELDNPSFLTLSPDEKIVYSVSEKDGENSAVHALSFDKKQGKLTPLNSMPINSRGPCYISIDGRGRNVHTANYGGGSISSFTVNGDGSLAQGTSVMLFSGSSIDSVRQANSHLHAVRYSPDGQYLFAADLGTDKVYRFDIIDTPFEGQPAVRESSLKEWETPPGTGPRHFDFHPDGGRFMYLLGELSGEVIVYDYHFGELKQKQVIQADTLGAQGSADIHVSPDGRFLYASNRLQADGIAIFSIDPDEGTLSRVGYQPTAKHPRNFAITPNGEFLLVGSRDENKIQLFRIDSNTGLLTNTHQDTPISKPVCLKFASTN